MYDYTLYATRVKSLKIKVLLEWDKWVGYVENKRSLWLTTAQKLLSSFSVSSDSLSMAMLLKSCPTKAYRLTNWLDEELT